MMRVMEETLDIRGWICRLVGVAKSRLSQAPLCSLWMNVCN